MGERDRIGVFERAKTVILIGHVYPTPAALFLEKQACCESEELLYAACNVRADARETEYSDM